ncbi:MAG TPA: class I SAM-dependent methyltransferase [Clostridiaceae bacterium]
MISNRLKKIAALVEHRTTLADIGTDHGYLPIYLIENDISSKVIATDVSLPSVNKAIKNIEIKGLSDFIECRIGYGLACLKEEKIETIVIAGMGGNLIGSILSKAMEKINNYGIFIFQPVQNPERLRKYLYENGFLIYDEDLCFEEDIYYEIIKAKYINKTSYCEEIYYEISSILLEKKHPLMLPYINYKLDKLNKILEYIKVDSIEANRRRDYIKEKITRMVELKNGITD